MHPEPFDANMNKGSRPYSNEDDTRVPGAGIRPSHKFLRIAHRGAAGLELENTLRAIETGLRYGVEMVEIDVRPAADGTLVVFHDDELKRITRRPGRVSTSSLAELRAIDLGGGERIPTLDEVLALVRGRALINIDQKVDNLAHALLKSIERAGKREDTLLSGNARVTFKAFRELAPTVRLGVSIGASWIHAHKYLLARHTAAGARGQAGSIIAAARAVMADTAALDYRLAAPRVVERLHRAGLPVLTWTVDDLPTMRALRQAGVDGVTSNRPDLLAQLI